MGQNREENDALLHAFDSPLPSVGCIVYIIGVYLYILLCLLIFSCFITTVLFALLSLYLPSGINSVLSYYILS